MKQTLYYSLPLFGNQFKGEVYNLVQLSAKFQIWCEQFGISNWESLYLWVAGDSDNDDEAIKLAKEAYNKLPAQTGCIDVAALVPDGEICFTVLNITVNN